MRIQGNPPLHLTYCLNVHPGETWAENFAAIADKAMAVRRRVGADGPFGLGLRLSFQAAQALHEKAALADFKAFLADNGLYAFTINGFPYGTFHRSAVKVDVYRPDWRSPQRLEYTRLLAKILAELLPEGVPGSISTVPGTYKAWVGGQADIVEMVQALARAAADLAEIHRRTGKRIVLALEPEPDCFLETVDELLRFFKGPLAQLGAKFLVEQLGISESQAPAVLAENLGVCYDTAHMAVEFQDLAGGLRRLIAAGVKIGKVQLSSALCAEPCSDMLERLAPFAEGVYLHQVKVLMEDGKIISWPDLPEALAWARENGLAGQRQWRIHFHVPLFFERSEGLASSSSLLTGDFAALLRQGATPHVEIETYTFNVLPPVLAVADITEGIAREYRWVMEKLLGHSPLDVPGIGLGMPADEIIKSIHEGRRRG